MVRARRQGHIAQQPVAAIPNFGGSSPNSASFRLWEPASVPTPREIVKALNSFVIGQLPAKKARCAGPSGCSGRRVGKLCQ